MHSKCLTLKLAGAIEKEKNVDLSFPVDFSQFYGSITILHFYINTVGTIRGFFFCNFKIINDIHNPFVPGLSAAATRDEKCPATTCGRRKNHLLAAAPRTTPRGPRRQILLLR